MKTLLLGLTLLTSNLLFASSTSSFITPEPRLEYEVNTYQYLTKYYPGHGDKVGVDTACQYKVFSHKDGKIIRLEAVNAGMWIELDIPKDKLPLKDDYSFITGNTLQVNLVTYKNGVLSQRLLDIKKSTLVNQTIATLMVDANLRNPKLVEGSDVSVDKNRLGQVSLNNIFSIKCGF